MNIVHVEDYFDPDAGYQINELLYASKNKTDKVYLITSNDLSPFHKTYSREKDQSFEAYTGIEIIRLDIKFSLWGRIWLDGLEKVLKKIEPDFVYLHGIGDFKDLFLWFKKKEYSIVRDCHMSWVASKNPYKEIYYVGFKLFFAPFINRTTKYKKVFALGNEEYEYLQKIGISRKKIDFLRHGYNKNVMYFDQSERDIFRQKYNIDDNDIVISYIGKFNHFKRPDYVLDIVDILLSNYSIDHNIKVMFLGPKDEQYMKTIFNPKKERIESRVEIIIEGEKDFKKLKKYYSASDICIFPKETTLSSIHAQVCGCHVIMEKHESNLERVVNPDNLYAEDDLIAAAQIVRKIISSNHLKHRNLYISKLADREYTNQISYLEKIILNP